MVALNPRDVTHVGLMGVLIAFSGDWASGLPMVERAMRLNPHHVRWLNFAHHWDHYRKHEYEKALDAAERINTPGYDFQSLVLAATCGQLGRLKAAKGHLDTLLEIGPELASNARAEVGKWLVSDELVEHVVDGLRKAGLEIDGDPPAAPDVATTPEAPRPFVGRRVEFDKLVARLDAIAGGTGTLVLLGGEPGVGKTRLSEELLAEARQRGMLALTGHCYEEGQAPFAPFIEILEQLLREMPVGVLRDALGEDAADLTRLVPKIRSVLNDVPEPAELEPEQQRRVLFNAVLDLFRRLSARQPVVLLLDDLHWADEATVGLLQHLVPHLSDLALLGVGTYRDVELDVGKPFEKAMATLVRQKQAVRVPVRRLPETAVAELLTALGNSEPPASLVEAIFQETEGNPFFVGEVFHHLSEEGKLFDESGAWKPDLTVDELDVPEGVRLVVGRRLERLSEATPTMLTSAAVVGRRFDLTLVEALGDVDSEAFLAAIEEAEAAQLIASERPGRETTYVFTHELVRATLLGALSLPRRQRSHARVADAIEAVYTSDLPRHASALARHLYEAGAAADETKTVRYLTLAADQALETGGFEGALRNIERALPLVRDERHETRAALLLKRGMARRGMGQWLEAIPDMEATLSLYERLQDDGAIATVCVELAYLYVWMMRPVPATAILRRGLEALSLEPSVDRCRLLGYLALTLGMECDFELADSARREADAMYAVVADDRVEGETLLLRAFFFLTTNRRHEHMDAIHRALPLLRAAGDVRRLAEALAQQQYASVWMGRLGDVAMFAVEAQALGARLGFKNVEVCAALASRQRDWAMAPDLDALDDSLRRFAALTTEMGGGLDWIREAAQARAALWRGSFDAAREHARTSLVHEPPGIYKTGLGWSGLFLCECMLGNVAPALELLDAHRDGLPRPGVLNSEGAWQALFQVVEGLAVLDDRDRVSALYPSMLEAIETGTVVTHEADRLVETLTGMAAAAGRQWQDAETHYQTALHLADEVPVVSEQAEARYWYALMLVDRDDPGDRERAGALLDSALQIYRKIGMPWHVERAEKLVAEASG